MMRRGRAPTNPLEAANRKSDDDFVRDYLLSRYGPIQGRSGGLQLRGGRSLTRRDSPAWTSEWTHPKTGAEYTIQLSQAPSLSHDDFKACFRLIEETSAEDYKA